MQTEGSKPSIQRYLNVVWSRKWSSLAILILVVLTAYYFTSQQTSEYTSSAAVLVKPFAGTGVGTTSSQGGSIFNLNTEVRVASSAEVADLAAKKLDEKDPLSLLSGLSVTVVPSTEILSFSYTDPNPDAAKQRAEAFAEAYLDNRQKESQKAYEDSSALAQDRVDALNKKIKNLQNKLNSTSSNTESASLTRQIGTLEGALASAQQQAVSFSVNPPGDVGSLIQPAGDAGLSGPAATKNLAVAALLGLILAVAIAFLRDRMDTRVTERRELEHLIGAPVLGAVPNIGAWRRKKTPLIVSISQPDSPAAEAFRTIRTGLVFAAGQRNAKTILITSSQASEGKTSTTANLGVVLAQGGKRVIVVGGDLRRTRLSEFFPPSTQNGLAEVLNNNVALEDALVATREPNLWLLPGGHLADRPGELLASEVMGTVLARLKEKVDYILIDSAPVLVAADALALVPHVEGIVFVCDSSKTTAAMVSDARERMFNVHAPILGAILNNYQPEYHGAYSVYRAYFDKQGKSDGNASGPRPVAPSPTTQPEDRFSRVRRS